MTRRKSLTVIFCVLLVALLCPGHALSMPAEVSPKSALDAGYADMYNLDFVAAHDSFHSWERLHPDDPLGPVSDAAAYLFSEFHRLHILEVELFTDNEKYESREKPAPDPHTKAAFEQALAGGQHLADQALARDAKNREALFAEILANGLHGDYLALIEKRNFAGLRYMKTSRGLAEKLLSMDPSYYDAYLAVGVENYLLGINPAPVRWLLRMGGAQTDKDQGIAKLRLTAEHGRYLAPYARLLLAVAALRDHDRTAAKNLLQALAQEFPRNPLYGRELVRLNTGN
jgi:hypothetical protein